MSPRPEVDEAEPASLQSRFESGPVGRCIITWFVGLVLLTVVASNLPGSSLRRDVERVVAPVEDTFALGQDWALFAPNPSSRSTRLTVTVTDHEGTSRLWHPPAEEADGITAYRGYHWRKFSESVLHRPTRERLIVLARWIAGQQREPVSRVRIDRETTDPLLPGARPKVRHLLDLAFSPTGAPEPKDGP